MFSILGTDDPAVVGRHLSQFYVDNAEETARRAHASLLDAFYEGKGDEEMERIVDLCWTDPKNNARRKAFIKAGLDKFNNVIARIAREKATVYSEPPRRTIKNENEKYQEFLDLVQMDDAMRELDRKLAYHEDALLWYRVRVAPTGEREPLLEVVSPSSFWAVCHPQDRTMLVAIIFDQRMPMGKPSDPSYRVWTDDQTFVMNAKCEIFTGSIEAWPIGMMPGVLCSTRKPGSKATLLAPCPSSDLLSAQRAVRLQDLNLAKESISANRQTYVTGDTSATAMGQTADTDTEVFLGEGVQASAIDKGLDQTQFRDNATYTVDTTSSNHGLPPAVLHQRDAASGAEIELRRIPIRELRKERIPVFRRIEHRIARVMSLVNGLRESLDENQDPVLIPGDMPEHAFDIEGWSIDFGEIQQPLTESESLDVFEKKRRLGLTDNYEEEMRRNPDIRSYDEAKAIVSDRIKRQTEFVAEQKELMALNGSLGSEVGEPTAESNGTNRDTETGPNLRKLAMEILDGAHN
jgi:hypothetical protein